MDVRSCRSNIRPRTSLWTETILLNHDAFTHVIKTTSNEGNILRIKLAENSQNVYILLLDVNLFTMLQYHLVGNLIIP